MAYKHDMMDKIIITKIRHIVYIDMPALMFHNDLTYFMDKMVGSFFYQVKVWIKNIFAVTFLSKV